MDQGTPLDAFNNSRVDFDAVCHKMRAAIEPARAHAVSLHDETGEIVWLSEGSMGPDEHNAAREAVDRLKNIRSPAVVAYDLGDARSAVMLRAVNGRRAMAGMVMLVMDTRALKLDDKGAVKLMTPQLQRVLAQFAETRPDLTPAPEVTPAAPAAASLTARAATPVSPEMDRLHAALRRSSIALHVQRLVPLCVDRLPTCYEVLLRYKTADAPDTAPFAMLKAAVDHGLGSMIDRRVLTELIGWLVHHPDARQTAAMTLSVNLTRTALHDEHFIKFVDLCLAKSQLPKAMIAFEIDVSTALVLGSRIYDIAAALDRLGCPIVLDDLKLNSQSFELLRLPGVRYVKLAPPITAGMRSDKTLHAGIAAVTQMARGLEIHTVAKHTDSAVEQEWLKSLGVDFIQSNAFAPSAGIDTLLCQPPPKALTR